MTRIIFFNPKGWLYEEKHEHRRVNPGIIRAALDDAPAFTTEWEITRTAPTVEKFVLAGQNLQVMRVLDKQFKIKRCALFFNPLLRASDEAAKARLQPLLDFLDLPELRKPALTKQYKRLMSAVWQKFTIKSPADLTAWFDQLKELFLTKDEKGEQVALLKSYFSGVINIEEPFVDELILAFKGFVNAGNLDFSKDAQTLRTAIDTLFPQASDLDVKCDDLQVEQVKVLLRRLIVLVQPSFIVEVLGSAAEKVVVLSADKGDEVQGKAFIQPNLAAVLTSEITLEGLIASDALIGPFIQQYLALNISALDLLLVLHDATLFDERSHAFLFQLVNHPVMKVAYYEETKDLLDRRHPAEPTVTFKSCIASIVDAVKDFDLAPGSHTINFIRQVVRYFHFTSLEFSFSFTHPKLGDYYPDILLLINLLQHADQFLEDEVDGVLQARLDAFTKKLQYACLNEDNVLRQQFRRVDDFTEYHEEYVIQKRLTEKFLKTVPADGFGKQKRFNFKPTVDHLLFDVVADDADDAGVDFAFAEDDHLSLVKVFASLLNNACFLDAEGNLTPLCYDTSFFVFDEHTEAGYVKAIALQGTGEVFVYSPDEKVFSKNPVDAPDLIHVKKDRLDLSEGTPILADRLKTLRDCSVGVTIKVESNKLILVSLSGCPANMIFFPKQEEPSLEFEAEPEADVLLGHGTVDPGALRRAIKGPTKKEKIKTVLEGIEPYPLGDLFLDHPLSDKYLELCRLQLMNFLRTSHKSSDARKNTILLLASLPEADVRLSEGHVWRLAQRELLSYRSRPAAINHKGEVVIFNLEALRFAGFAWSITALLLLEYYLTVQEDSFLELFTSEDLAKILVGLSQRLLLFGMYAIVGIGVAVLPLAVYALYVVANYIKDACCFMLRKCGVMAPVETNPLLAAALSAANAPGVRPLALPRLNEALRKVQEGSIESMGSLSDVYAKLDGFLSNPASGSRGVQVLARLLLAPSSSTAVYGRDPGPREIKLRAFMQNLVLLASFWVGWAAYRSYQASLDVEHFRKVDSTLLTLEARLALIFNQIAQPILILLAFCLFELDWPLHSLPIAVKTVASGVKTGVLASCGFLAKRCCPEVGRDAAVDVEAVVAEERSPLLGEAPRLHIND